MSLYTENDLTAVGGNCTKIQHKKENMIRSENRVGWKRRKGWKSKQTQKSWLP